MLRKVLISTLTLGLAFSSFTPSFATESKINRNSSESIEKLAIYKKWGPYLVRPTTTGDNDEVNISLHEEGYICIWQVKSAEFGNHFVHSLARLNFYY